jgi:hypothetical protein
MDFRAAAEQLRDDFTKPKPALRLLILELCDPAPRDAPFVTSDYLAAFTREVLTRGQDYGARWADLTKNGCGWVPDGRRTSIGR